MATVYSRPRKSGGVTWYTKVKQPNGTWKPVALRGVTTGPAARKLAFEIEQQQQRQSHGLETGALFLGTFAELCAWAFGVHFARLGSAQADGSRLRCHVGCHVGDLEAKPPQVTWLGALPARKVTHHALARYFSEMAATLPHGARRFHRGIAFALGAIRRTIRRARAVRVSPCGHG